MLIPCLTRLRTLSKLAGNYSEDELNQLDQCEEISEQEEILSDLLVRHEQFDLIIYLKNSIFDEISIYRILQFTIEKLSDKIR